MFWPSQAGDRPIEGPQSIASTVHLPAFSVGTFIQSKLHTLSPAYNEQFNSQKNILLNKGTRYNSTFQMLMSVLNSPFCEKILVRAYSHQAKANAKKDQRSSERDQRINSKHERKCSLLHSFSLSLNTAIQSGVRSNRTRCKRDPAYTHSDAS